MPVETCVTCGCRYNSDYGQHLCDIQDPVKDGAERYLDTVGALQIKDPGQEFDAAEKEAEAEDAGETIELLTSREGREEESTGASQTGANASPLPAGERDALTAVAKSLTELADVVSRLMDRVTKLEALAADTKRKELLIEKIGQQIV